MRLPDTTTQYILAAAILPVTALASAAEPLPSWNDSASRQAIVDFVVRVASEDSPHYVKPAERIAVFDNDGTLWPEQPLYVQVAFAVERLKSLAPRHPEWRDAQPFKALLQNDMQALNAAGERGIVEIMSVAHAGMTTEEFAGIASRWLDTARHPRFKRPYTELVYQPMLELLDYLRAHDFKTFIVSGGGIEFMRVFAERVYGIPPEQVIGSSAATQFQINSDGRPVLLKQARVEFIDDGPGKPSGINRFIGRRPLFAFGNSDGDLQMLQWTAAGWGPRFVGLVHHTDAGREYAYDRQSRVGRLDKALDEARLRRWTIVDVQQDWGAIFPPAP